MIRKAVSPIISLLFPRQCVSCRIEPEDTHQGVACRDCWQRTRFFRGDEMLCGKCGAYFGIGERPLAVDCTKCTDFDFDTATALGIYEHALLASVISLKTSPKLPHRLREELRSTDRIPADVDTVIPVPLSKKRLLERGHDQAAIIATEIGSVTRIPVDSSNLIRKKHTPIHRAGMDDRARVLSVKNAFEVVRPNFVNGRDVLLVDDVFTSGATASACAKVLKKAGAGKVGVFTLARAVLDPVSTF
jgi:ComF family protein